jgi:hypothetical protein
MDDEGRGATGAQRSANERATRTSALGPFCGHNHHAIV